MKKIKMLIELEYDDELWHGETKQQERWFQEDILGLGCKLQLYSQDVGDYVGKVTVFSMEVS